MFLCLSCPSATFGLWHGSFEAHERRAIARFFLMGVGGGGGHYHECQRAEPFKGDWEYPPPGKFQIWRLQNAIFSTCHEICLSKINLK